MRTKYWLLSILPILGLSFLLPELMAASTEPKWEVIKGPVSVTLRAVYFADEQTVFAVGNSATIIVSTDAGKSWSSLTSGSNAILRGVHFIDAQRGWVCGDGDSSAPKVGNFGHYLQSLSDKQGTCLITSDVGKNWQNVLVDTNFYLPSIWMASATVGHICHTGGSGHLDGSSIITNDGGNTWVMTYISPNGSRQLTRVFRALNDSCWISAQEGWAVGSPVSVSYGTPAPTDPLYTQQTARIIYTSNGGTKWAPQSSSAGSKELYSVWFVDKNFGCAVGSGGEILFTSDGGTNWKKPSGSVTTQALCAVCFIDNKNGWTVGAGGVIFKTSTGGDKWESQTSPVKETLYGLHFNKTGQTGIAVGTKGTIIRFTTNINDPSPPPPPPPGTEQEVAGSSGGEFLGADAFTKPVGRCFIAGTVYGSPNHPNVITLRKFRDNYLLTNPVGKYAVEEYYRLGPSVAENLKYFPTLSSAVRLALTPIYAIRYPIALMLGVLLLLLAGFWFTKARRFR